MSQVNYSNAIPNLSNGNEAARNLKIPPHSIEAEQSVIGAIMLDCQAFDRVANIIQVEDFYRYDHRLIWQAAVELNADKIAFDIVTFCDYMEKHGNLKDAGGLAYLGTVAKDTPSAANVVFYADIVKNDSILRQIIGAAEDTKDMAFARQYKAKDVIAKLESTAFKIADSMVKPTGGMVSIKVALKETLLEIHALSKRDPNEQLLGITTGSNALDTKLSGFVKGDLIVVAARPSMGKTTLAMNFAEAAAEKKPVAVFSLEMPTNQLVKRLLASSSTLNLNSVRNSWEMQENDWAKLSVGSQALHKRKLYLEEAATLTVSGIRSSCRRLVRKLETTDPDGLGLIVIDYLQLMSASTLGSNRNAEITEITRQLKQTALEFDVPIILLSQLNRSVEQRPNKRPVMSDLRDSGAIEQDADVIMFLYREEVYNPETPDKGIVEVIIRKYRNGEIGTIKQRFEGKYARFRDLDDSGSFGGGSDYVPPSNPQRKQRGSF